MEREKRKIHDWFELTYSSYLILQRTILQSMPDEWQEKFVELLDELEVATSELKDLPGSFWIRAKDGNHFIKDPYSNYERGRRIINLTTPKP